MRKRYTSVLVASALTFTPLEQLSAGQSTDNNLAGGLNVAVDLRHRIVIPQIIYFRIGSDTPGVIDKLNFNVNAGAPGPGNNQNYAGPVPPAIGNGSSIVADGGGALQVRIYANVGSVNLSYDLSDPQGLSDGAGNYIPFDEIDVQSADPGGLPAPVLANAGAGGAISVPISGNLMGGRVVRRQTTWTFSYDNNQVVSAGTYDGRVRYTVSAP